MVLSTHLKNMSQIGNLTQLGVKIRNTWNHHLVLLWRPEKPSITWYRYLRICAFIVSLSKVLRLCHNQCWWTWQILRQIFFSKEKHLKHWLTSSKHQQNWKKSVKISVAFFSRAQWKREKLGGGPTCALWFNQDPGAGKKTRLGRKKRNRPRCRKIGVSVLGRWWWCCEDSSEMDRDLTRYSFEWFDKSMMAIWNHFLGFASTYCSDISDGWNL